MKRITPLILSVALVSALALMSHHNGVAEEQGKDRTGAPGSDANCEYCHQPGATVPVSSVVLIDANGVQVDSYIPETVYDVEFKVQSDWAIGYGFQGTAVVAGGDNAGVFSEPGTNVQLENVGGRHIVEHSDINPNSVFSVKWTSPSAGAGDVAFYNAGLAVNGAYGNGGDAYHGTAKTITEVIDDSVEENLASVEVQAPYVSNGVITWNAHNNGVVKIYDLNGKLVSSSQVQGLEKVSVQAPQNGIYIFTYEGINLELHSWKIAA